MTDETKIGFPSLRPLVLKAGIPEEMHDVMVAGIANFTTAMTVLMKANEDVAPNLLTFSIKTPAGQMYEFTIRKSEGKTPAEVITDLEAKLVKVTKHRGELMETLEDLYKESIGVKLTRAELKILRLEDEITRLQEKYESKCKCGSRKAALYTECEYCYVSS